MFSKHLLTGAIIAASTSTVLAHVGAYHKAMYCLNGYSNDDQPNNDQVSNPLLNLSMDDFWFGKCKDYPPEDGVYLDLNAGGTATVEHATNRGQSTLSFNGSFVSDWPDGGQHDEYENGTWNNTCITTPNLHTENQTRAAGTVLAIAYQSDISKVKYEDMVIISVLPSTPWNRVAEYEIPKDLPPCDDCICAYSWIPNHCGIPNMYLNAIKCRVVGGNAASPPLGKAKPATWCEKDPSQCVSGPRGITIYNQQTSANTIDLTGITQADGQPASPCYDSRTGFAPGAQTNIFDNSGSSGSPSATVAPSSSAPSATSAATTSSDSSPPAQSSAPAESCNSTFTSRQERGHRKHQRRLFHVGRFSVSMDE